MWESITSGYCITSNASCNEVISDLPVLQLKGLSNDALLLCLVHPSADVAQALLLICLLLGCQLLIRQRVHADAVGVLKQVLLDQGTKDVFARGQTCLQSTRQLGASPAKR